MTSEATDTRSAQQRLTDFRPETLADRHERQFTLLQATGHLGASPPRVLDLGCGSGVTAIWAGRKGWHTKAVDAEELHTAILRDYLREHEPDLPVEVVTSDVSRFRDFQENSFDVVYLLSLFEHVDDVQTCLDTAHSAVRPGGLVYISTTNVFCPIQQEYHGVGPFPWYPRWLKERIRIYALTKKPAIVKNSKRPAVNWFRRRALAATLGKTGFRQTWDLYTLVRKPRDLTRRTRLAFPIVRAARFFPFGRDLANFIVPDLTIVALK